MTNWDSVSCVSSQPTMRWHATPCDATVRHHEASCSRPVQTSCLVYTTSLQPALCTPCCSAHTIQSYMPDIVHHASSAPCIECTIHRVHHTSSAPCIECTLNPVHPEPGACLASRSLSASVFFGPHVSVRVSFMKVSREVRYMSSVKDMPREVE